MRNHIVDVAGIRVGHADDKRLSSGVTAIVLDAPAVASVAVLGGAPGGRDLGCLEPDATVPGIDAIVLSGGSGFGLEAGGGVQAWLREQGRGFAVGQHRVPIVPGAILFDLNNGGDKSWGRYAPYRELGYAAASAAETGGEAECVLGSVGAGFGAATVDLKGGLGSASAVTTSGFVVGAIVAVNALGSAVIGGGPQFWAAGLERGTEFGGLGLPAVITPEMQRPAWKGAAPPSTTIGCVATDARLDKAQAKRLAITANDGLARGLRLAHTAMDGDTVFAIATGRADGAPSLHDLIEIGVLAADCLARAIARAVFCASVPSPQWVGPPAWCDRFAAQVSKSGQL